MKALRAALLRELEAADWILILLWFGSFAWALFCALYVFPQALA